MRYSIVTVTATLSLALHAQVPQPEVTDLPWLADELKGKEGWTVGTWASDGKVLVQEEVSKTTRRLRCRSLDDGRTVAMADLPTAGNANLIVFPNAVPSDVTDRSISGLEVYGNAVWFIETHWVRSSGNYKMFAHGFSLPALTPLPSGPPIVDLDLKQTGFAGRFLLGIEGFSVYAGYKGKIVKSPNGTKLAYFWDDLRGADGTRMAVVKVFNDRFEPLGDHRGYHLQFKNKGMFATDVAVGDDGVVYAVQKIWSQDKDPSAHDLHFSYELLRFGEDLQHRPINLDGGAAVYSTTLVALPEGPRVGGFFVHPEVTTDATVGAFAVDFHGDLSGTRAFATFPFTTPIEHGVENAKFITQADAGFYLVGTVEKEAKNSTQFHEICAFNVGHDLRLIWQSVIPRHYGATYWPNIRYVLTKQNALVVVFEDLAANISLRKSGAPVRKLGEGDGIPVAASFDREGRADYAEVQVGDADPRSGVFSVRNFGLRVVGPGTFVSTANGTKRGEFVVRSIRY